MKLHRLTAHMAIGALLTLPLWAHAAGLGKLTVKSALGQPLSAEIELLIADKSELDSLNVNMASGDAFKDAQIEYAYVLSTLQFTVGKGAGGKPVLKLSSSKPVNDPFMDMLIELNWASGRLLREYTILLDPPGVAVPQTVSPVAVSIPEVKPVPAPVQPVAEQPAQMPSMPSTVNPYAVASTPGQKAQATIPEPVAAEQASTMESKIRVKRGDTLSSIANQVRPSHVSLEQALVALFHENQDAFVGGNMNRLKAGKTLSVPSAEAMTDIDQSSARREVSLQAADWHAYRAKLAESVAAQPEEEQEKTSKTVIGKVTPKVEDKAQPKPEEAKDVLKLSRANAAAAAAAAAKAEAEQKAAAEKAAAEAKAQAEEEDRLAREKALKESSERAASLEKQIQDMQKLAEMKEQQAATAQTEGAQSSPADAAPKVEASPPAPVEEPQTSFVDEILENQIYWVGGLGAVVLGGILWWMMAGGRRRRSASDTSASTLITGTDMQPSVAGTAATGGVVNTGDTSFLTDFSQAGLAEIDTHDVDPIAEADVYMAYGRDAQAEEILKEALNKSPERHEIRLKLLEIYAARKNVSAFEEVAGQLYAALGGQAGPTWDKAVEMGRAIDPHNPLYGGSGQPDIESAPVLDTPAPMVANEVEVEPEAAAPAETVLDFSTDTPDLDLDIPTLSEPKAEEPKVAEPAQKETSDLDFDLSGFDLNVPEEPASKQPTAPSMDFSGLDLNLGDAGDADEFDEVATKLDLARAYLEMGDKDGAREILQEVINEGNDKQKSDAKSIIASL